MNLYLFVVARSAATRRCIHLTAFDGLPQSASLLRNEKHEFIGRGYDVLVWIEETSSSVPPGDESGPFTPVRRCLFGLSPRHSARARTLPHVILCASGTLRRNANWHPPCDRNRCVGRQCRLPQRGKGRAEVLPLCSAALVPPNNLSETHVRSEFRQSSIGGGAPLFSPLLHHCGSR